MAIKLGIIGYGNLGRGVEAAVRQNPDMELEVVFTRRNPESVKIATKSAKVANVADAAEWKDRLDVVILCSGSATDLPVQTPEYAKLFNVVDSFDTHAKIPEHFAKVDASARAAGKVAAISLGWDPGLFSLNRMYAGAILPEGKDYTFWGRGVSQGHSDAVRRIAGVKNAKQYTIPVTVRSTPSAGAKPPNFPRAKNTSANASSFSKTARTPNASNAKSRRCPTTSPTTTQPCTSSTKPNATQTTRKFRTAAWFSESAKRASKRKTRTS